MPEDQNLLELAKETLLIQAHAIEQLVPLLDENFTKSVNAILQSQGRVVVSGIGKSAIIATKMVATFNSTGTPAIFMHAADAIHGDLGTIQKEDVVICLSKSGNTEEIKMLIPLIKRGGNVLIAITGEMNSTLAQQSDFVLNCYVDKEACPNNLAPTTSTTAQLVLGDALAISLLKTKGFTAKDFAKFHPGGALGKKLYLRVGDLINDNQKPMVQKNTPIKDVIIEISEKMMGAAAVLDKDILIGVITDGDIRRMLSKYEDLGGITAQDIMTANPKTITSDALAITASEYLKTHGITQILVKDDDHYKGVVHLHQLLKEGIA